MENTIAFDSWLKLLDSEYLTSFIRKGGASIKFVVTPEGEQLRVCRSLTKHCANAGYVSVELNAVDSRVHMPQDIFWGIAKQVDWRELARRVVLRLASGASLEIESIDPGASANIFESIGMMNEIPAQSVLRELRPRIENNIARNDQMAKDFRVAMAQLCLTENTRDMEYHGQPLLDWLTGVQSRVGYVRQFYIYTSINRMTARHFIESALFWFQFAGYEGTVILLDNSRVTITRKPADGLRFYTKAMVVDHYELLREFVDTTDQLTGTLLIVVTSNEFLDETQAARGFGIYPALMTRVMDDIRDKNMVNPIASLIRLSDEDMVRYD